MSRLEGAPPERIADYFVTYLFEEYRGSPHVRRVASWVGLIVMAIQRAAFTWRVPRARQLRFDYADHSFKAKFNHQAGPRGGIEIVEILSGQGSPKGHVVISITTLEQAADFYDRAEEILSTFVAESASAAHA